MPAKKRKKDEFEEAENLEEEVEDADEEVQVERLGEFLQGDLGQGFVEIAPGAIKSLSSGETAPVEPIEDLEKEMSAETGVESKDEPEVVDYEKAYQEAMEGTYKNIEGQDRSPEAIAVSRRGMRSGEEVSQVRGIANDFSTDVPIIRHPEMEMARRRGGDFSDDADYLTGTEIVEENKEDAEKRKYKIR